VAPNVAHDRRRRGGHRSSTAAGGRFRTSRSAWRITCRLGLPPSQAPYPDRKDSRIEGLGCYETGYEKFPATTPGISLCGLDEASEAQYSVHLKATTPIGGGGDVCVALLGQDPDPPDLYRTRRVKRVNWAQQGRTRSGLDGSNANQRRRLNMVGSITMGRTREGLTREQLQELSLEHQERLLQVLRRAGLGGLSPHEAAVQAGLLDRTARRALARLEANGTARRDKNRWYAHPASSSGSSGRTPTWSSSTDEPEPEESEPEIDLDDLADRVAERLRKISPPARPSPPEPPGTAPKDDDPPRRRDWRYWILGE
jgi:hypothetical protein